MTFQSRVPKTEVLSCTALAKPNMTPVSQVAILLPDDAAPGAGQILADLLLSANEVIAGFTQELAKKFPYRG